MNTDEKYRQLQKKKRKKIKKNIHRTTICVNGYGICALLKRYVWDICMIAHLYCCFVCVDPLGCLPFAHTDLVKSTQIIALCALYLQSELHLKATVHMHQTNKYTHTHTHTHTDYCKQI